VTTYRCDNDLDRLGSAVREWTARGQPTTLSRVSQRTGFGSVPNGGLLAINHNGQIVGGLLGGTGRDGRPLAERVAATQSNPGDAEP
jgi:hypothetical protein